MVVFDFQAPWELNCFSALQKWLDVAQSTFCAAQRRLKYYLGTCPQQKWSMHQIWPKKGIFISLSPKLEEMHWLSKSPAKPKVYVLTRNSRFSNNGVYILLYNFTFCLFPKSFSPQNSSSKHWSKYFARGP